MYLLIIFFFVFISKCLSSLIVRINHVTTVNLYDSSCVCRVADICILIYRYGIKL